MPAAVLRDADIRDGFEDARRFETYQTLEHILEGCQGPATTQRASKDARTRFWETYKREAAEYDTEFLDKYKSDVDIVLIFSGLFSAVCTSFIIAMQPSLSPDPNDTSNALLKLLVHTIDNNTFAGQSLDLPVWTGPSPTVIWVQILVYASLSISLLAALGAMLGKQWLGHFNRLGRGPIDERGRRRQEKLSGLRTWHFDAVLEALPVLLQISLLLFGIALAANVWTQEPAVASIIVATIVFGLTFYIAIVASSLMSRDCPFQTPASNILRIFGKSLVKGRLILRRRYRTLVTTIRHYLEVLPIAVANILKAWSTTISTSYHRSPFFTQTPPVVGGFTGAIPIVATTQTSVLTVPALTISHIPADPRDAQSVQWLIETSTDPNVITAAAQIVPEVEWPLEFDVTTILLQLCDTFLGCYDGTKYDQLSLIPFARDRALACGKALIHLYLERLWFQWDLLCRLFDGHPHRSRLVAVARLGRESRCPGVPFDPDLDYIYRMISSIIEPGFGGVEPPMEDIPDGQLMWMSHLIPHFLNDPRRSYRLAEAASDMITRLLARPLLPQNTLANCLLATCLLMGSRVGPNELVKLDKSPAVETLLDLALEGLRDRLSKDVIRQRLNLDPTDPTVNALKLLYPLAFLVDVEKFRVIFDNRGIPVWAMQFSKTLVQKALHGATLHPVARFMLCRDARNALRLRLNIITRRIHPYPTSEGFIEWMTWDDPKEDEADFHWLVDFLIYQCKENDYVAIGDALLTLSNIRGLDKCARITGYIGAIIAASGSGMPLRVRHAALKAACAIRNELANPQGEATRARLLDDFSSALWRAALLTIDPPGYRQAPLSPDRFLYYHRDLCYVQIVFALAQNDIWETHLCNDGHFERCLAVAKELRDDNTLSQQHKGHLSLYVLALFVNPQTGELDLLANVVGRDYCDSLIVMAWAFLYAADRRRDDSHQAIRPLITCTMWRWRQRESIHGTPWKAVAVHAEHVLRVLRQENATPSLVHLVENLVVLIRNS